ncbi:hypothetical protein O3P69_005022 [Scylla paramamosain]|uniref:RRM domain-containing protein n=1 Tax=Scylla paramamosain TaxID=85552 RepID=A0AAW0UB98_SCYPA
MGENQINMSASKQLENKKTNMKKKKKRAKNKNQIIKVQGKNQAKVNVCKKNEKTSTIKKVNSLKEAEKNETEEQSGIDSKENMDQDTQKSRKPVKRNKRNLKPAPEKMELTPLLDQETEGRMSHRDERTLYVRFPPSLTLQDKSFLEPLVPSAVDIRFPRLSATSTAKYCYIEFETEEEATRIKESLPNIRIKGEAFYADYVGKRSKIYSEKEPRIVDPVRLYVGGLPAGIPASHLKATFPTAARILYKKPSRRVISSHAYIIFATHKDALRAFESSSDLKILGKEVIVMFATYKKNTYKNEEQSTTPAKKQKTEDVEMEEGNE